MSSDRIKISELPIASSVSDNDLVPIVQGGATKRATVGQIQTSVLLDQTFVTVANDSVSLPASRRLTASGGLQLTDNGAGNTFSLITLGVLNSLSSLASNGFIVNNGGTALARSLIPPAAGISIANSDGTSGNPTFSLTNDLLAVEGLAGTGFASRTSSDTWQTRTLTAPVAGLTITNPAGISGDPTFALANDLAALEGLGSTGFAVRSASDTWAQRTITAPNPGITVSNGDGVAGNPSIVAANDLAGLEGLGSTGFAVRSASDTWVQRSIAGTANEITSTNGDGVAGNPTLSLPTALTFTGKTVTGGTFSSPTITTPNMVAISNLTTDGYVKTSGGIGTLSVQTVPIPVADGGTGLTGGTSGGVLGYTAAGTLASSILLTANGIVIGGGAGATPTSTAAMTDGQVLVGQTSAAPLPKTLSGDVTAAASGAVTIANDAVTNAKLANVATQTIKGRTTAATGDPEDLTPAQVSAMLSAPQITVLTSGSGTYTVPTGAKYLIVEGVGGGGGAGGGQVTYNVAGATGSDGGATTFGSAFLTGNGGPGGTVSAVVATAATATGGDANIPGGTGTASTQAVSGGRSGNAGGNSYFGGAGGGGGDGQPGGVGGVNSGSGGGSGGSTAVNFVPGGGGNSGAYFRKLITSPAASYSYAVGAGGAAGTTATGGTSAAGGSGIIIVVAYFQ